jgi:WXG100 family type VII secretion target
MVPELRIHLKEMAATAHFLANQADELKAELDAIVRDWDGLASTWTGVAASAFRPPFEEWHDGALTITSILSEESRLLMITTAAMAENEQASAHALASIRVDGSAL